MTTPSLGELIYLAAYVFRVNVLEVTTFPDTPNQYTAQISVLGDRATMNTDPLTGPAGRAGVGDFALRDQTDISIVNTVFELPDDLTDTLEDVGKYWRLDTLDEYGYVTMVTAYVWYGTQWRAFMMGAYGPPGPVPAIHPRVKTIPPGQDAYVHTSGPTFQPSWLFELPIPAGAMGEPKALGFFPDVEETAIENLDVLTATGYLPDGEVVWQPLRIDRGIVGFYSMPESAFSSYTGVSQQGPIGSFVIPPQPFPWTPVVWGHIGGVGIELSINPFSIGCEILLGDQANGTMVARGLGNTLGVVNVMPHYSTASKTTGAVNRRNNYAVVPAYHAHPEQGTLYINLWNDGQLGAYFFTPQDAQLFVMVVPIEPPYTTITGVPRRGGLTRTGTVRATLSVHGKAVAIGNFHGAGTLSVSAHKN